MRKIISLLILSAIFLGGCASPAVDANPHYPDQAMSRALSQESAFCRAVANDENNPKKHLKDLPPWGYKENFSASLRELGYDKNLLVPVTDNSHIYARVEEKSREYSKKPLERYDMCMRELGWKNKENFNSAERTDNAKNTRAADLISEIKSDPQAELTLSLMLAELRRVSPYTAGRENLRMMSDPAEFASSYRTNREIAHKTPALANKTVKEVSVGMELARCSGIYNVVNGNRQEIIQREPSSRDRFISQEWESFDLAIRLIQYDTALAQKEAGATEFIKRSGPALPGILMEFQMESPKCSRLVQEAKKADPSRPIMR